MSDVMEADRTTEAVIEVSSRAPVPPQPAAVTLELVVPPALAGRLWRQPALMRLRAGRTRTRAIRITWHDTADGRLGEDGRALLHIEDGRTGRWRMEAARRDGRRLWPLGVPAPLDEAADPATLPDAPDQPTLPIAVLQGRRQILPVAPDHGFAEICLLHGVLMAGEAGQEVARLSCRGTPAAVFALARALLAEAPLTVPATSLSGDMLRALRGDAAPPPPVLQPDLDLDDAIAHIAAALSATLAHHAPGARAGRSPEAVHQMRVALRRLRSALSLFHKVAASPDLERAREALRGLAHALGPARDWDVFLSGTARDVAKLLPTETALARMILAGRRRRKAAYVTLRRMLDGPEFQRMLLDLTDLAVTRPWPAGDPADRPRLIGFARHALDRRLRRVAEVGDDLSGLPIEALHATRIQCKRLRYAAEFFAPLETGRHTRRFLRRLATVQERLGHLNDGAVAAGLMRDLGSRGFAAGIVHGYLAARNAGERAKAERSWRKFRRTEPFWT